MPTPISEKDLSEKDVSALFRAEKLRRDLGSAIVDNLLEASISPEDLETLRRADMIRRSLGGAEAVSTLLKEYKSRRTCPFCGAHKLVTNDSEKKAEITTIHYHCLNCNGHFFEHPQQSNCKEPATKSFDKASSKFWDKADRVVVMTAGGAAIGGAIAQIPGAIVGMLIGSSYGWYVAFSRRSSSENT